MVVRPPGPACDVADRQRRREAEALAGAGWATIRRGDWPQREAMSKPGVSWLPDLPYPGRRLAVPTDPADNDSPSLPEHPSRPHQDHQRRRRSRPGQSSGDIDQWGNVDRRALTPQSVNLMLKKRCTAGRSRPGAFSAHGLRSRLSDRGRQPRNAAAGGDATVAAQVGYAGGKLLQ